MNQMSLADLARAAGGSAQGDPDVLVGPDVVIDARRATPGSLFVAIPGERVDGHDFTQQARDNGAAAVLGSRATDADLAHVVVDDPVAGLSRLAKVVVDRARAAGIRVVAITGSSGKTSTKDILAQVLEAAGPTVSPEGSFNNEIGVPLTACRVDADTRFLVSEMGARGIGHIAWLTSLVQPDISVVLNVGTAHLGEFGSAENIAIAKGELVEALEPVDPTAPDAGGWAVLNADDPRVAGMAERTRGHLAAFTLTDAGMPGGSPSAPTTDADLLARAELVVRALDITHDDLQRHSFTLCVERPRSNGARSSAEVQLQTVGAHQVANALAAAAAALAAGVDLQTVTTALNSATNRSRWRMELGERADGVAVLNDSYNANPDSMTAALRTLSEMATARRASTSGARAVAVLGEMRELGDGSADEHRRIGALAAQLGIDELVAVDQPVGNANAAALVAGATDAGAVARLLPKEQVAASLELAAGDVVLVKGSRGVGLETVAAALLSDHPTDRGQTGAEKGADAGTPTVPPTSAQSDRGGAPTC